MITNVITQVVGQQQPTAVVTLVKCELLECPREASFDMATKEKVMADNPWLRTYRTVQTGDNRFIGYCSDTCEVRGVTSGKHNVPDPPKIVPAANAGAIALAAQAAANAKKAEQAIRDGQPANITITD